jgi:hypothetical protein
MGRDELPGEKERYSEQASMSKQDDSPKGMETNLSWIYNEATVNLDVCVRLCYSRLEMLAGLRDTSSRRMATLIVQIDRIETRDNLL